jgi:hypothetical protein
MTKRFLRKTEKKMVFEPRFNQSARAAALNLKKPLGKFPDFR